MNKAHSSASVKTPDSSLCFYNFNKRATRAMKSILPNHSLCFILLHHTGGNHLNVSRPRWKMQSTQNSIQQSFCYWTSLFVVIFFVRAWLYSISSEHSQIDANLHFIPFTLPRGVLFILSHLYHYCNVRARNKAINTYHLPFSFSLKCITA